ncbi:alpha/beta-hydrolase [Phellopilus nigrolimitatus]|nr:alpha/beta-hydrolase [Phellopilus nigrolimitatus]
MFAAQFIACALFLSLTVAVFGRTVEKRSISQSLMDDFKRYVQFASGAYQLACPSPLGTTLIKQFNDDPTNTQGFIARDDARKRLLLHADLILMDFSSTGVSGTSGVQAHKGFLTAFNSVASTVLAAVSEQLHANPTYSLVSTGHSLGASLASLGAISLASNFPGTPLKMYTFGQPRTGNPAYASLAEMLVGVDNIFRVRPCYYGVPTIPPTWLGYEHQCVKFFPHNPDSSHFSYTDANNVKQCSGREDPTCSDSIPSLGIDDAHLRYFGQVMALNSTVCS